jgi:hypothetical protein
LDTGDYYLYLQRLNKPGEFNKSNPANGATNQPLSLTLSWGSSSNAASYEYCYDTTNDNACSAWTSNGVSTSKSLSGLSLNTTYYWHVRAINGFETTYSDGSSTAFWSFTTSRVPDAFNKTLPANGATNQPLSLTLTWGSSNNANSYEYCYDTSNDNTCSTWVNTGASTSVPLSSLNSNTTYYWHVRAANAVGTTYSNGSSTAFWSFKTSPPPGAFNKTAPANNALKQSTNPTLKWGASVGATSYEYCYDTINNNTCDTSWGNTTLTSAAPSNLNNNTTYYWQVRAVNASGTIEANASVWWNFKVVIAPPTLQAPDDAFDLLNNRPTFDWEDVPGATGYTIKISRNSGFTSLVGTYLVSPSTYTPVTNLPANVTLYWRVQSRGLNGPSAWSAVRTVNTANPPGVPALLLPATNALMTDYTPRLDWGLATLPLGTTFGYYQIQVADNAAFTAPVIDVGAGVLIDRLVHEYTPGTDLNANTKYYWRVRAYNTDGEYSAWSLVRYLRTAILPPTLQAPDDGINLLYNRPAFDWEDVPGATGYTIKISRNSGFTSLVGTYLVTPSTYTPVANLPANVTLYWRVQSRGANGPSAWSGVRTVNTANPPSVPILLLPATNALTTDYTPRLDWGLVTLPLGTTFGYYQVQVADNAAFITPVIDVGAGVLNDRLVHEYTPGTELNPNTKYYWRVRAYNADGEYSAWSLVRAFRTALSAPVLSTPSNGAIATLLRPPFDWADVPGATSYTIQVSKNSMFTSLVVNKNTVGAVSNYTPLVNLPVNIPLYWRVRANGLNGPSLWSAPTWSFTVVP